MVVLALQLRRSCGSIEARTCDTLPTWVSGTLLPRSSDFLTGRPAGTGLSWERPCSLADGQLHDPLTEQEWYDLTLGLGVADDG